MEISFGNYQSVIFEGIVLNICVFQMKSLTLSQRKSQEKVVQAEAVVRREAVEVQAGAEEKEEGEEAVEGIEEVEEGEAEAEEVEVDRETGAETEAEAEHPEEGEEGRLPKQWTNISSNINE
eukprot:gene29710-38841_t